MIDTPNLTATYDALLEAVGAVAPDVIAASLTSHWPLVGRNFEHGVLAVGQAVYGWIPDWSPSDAATAAGRATILEDTKATFAELDDPMGWIGGHRVENSPFWRTVHEVTDALVPDPQHPWYSRVAWANLCPIAPNDRKANPEGILREVQTDHAAAFLHALVAELEPRLVLVLAGPFIWPFVRPLGLLGLDRVAPPLILAGTRDHAAWIAGMHPGGAQRRGWPARQYATVIVEKAKSLGV